MSRGKSEQRKYCKMQIAKCKLQIDSEIDRLAERLRHAARVTVLTGAGVSAASGVPTFRGADGLWRQYRATDLATPQAFARNPTLVWEWYAWRRQLIAGCQPNRAHDVLARWSTSQPQWQIVTQNVDDLHLRAGTRNLIRLHGSIWELSCWSGCGAEPLRWRDERVPLPAVPSCPHCGALARPAVVWFGEPLDPADVCAAEAATDCDVFIAAGTSAIVYPAAGLLDTARGLGAFTAEINLEATPASDRVDLSIHAPVEDVLDAMDARLR
jgi:NAD-dependent protein deacetylase/lipoamidase